MAVLIKNPVINANPVRKRANELQDHQTGGHNSHASDDTAASFIASDDIAQNGANQSDSSIQPVNDANIIITDGELNYNGIKYIAENDLERHLHDQVESYKAELRDEYSENAENGYKQGYQEGLERAATEFEEKVNNIKTLLENINHAYRQYYSEIEDQVSEIIYIAIARSFGELAKQKDERLAIIRNVIENVVNVNPVNIKVSNEDYKIIFDTENNELASRYNIEADNRVELGGCIIETDSGMFDGRLETQLSKYQEAVKAKAD